MGGFLQKLKLLSNNQQKRFRLAAFIAIIIHGALLFPKDSKTSNTILLENLVKASNSQSIQISLKQTKPTKKVKAKKVVKEKQKTKTKEVIPVVKNSSLTGQRTPPKYPRRALLHRKEGIVLLKALVNHKGEITKLELLQSSNFQSLDSSAIKTVKNWKFDPYIVNGKTSKFWVEIPIEFKLS